MDVHQNNQRDRVSRVGSSRFFRVLQRLERVAGTIISYATPFYIHFYILSIIYPRLNIDILSFPDTFEYRLIFGYLLVTQLVFADWFRKYLLKAVDLLVIPISKLMQFAENKLRPYFEGED